MFAKDIRNKEWEALFNRWHISLPLLVLRLYDILTFQLGIVCI